MTKTIKIKVVANSSQNSIEKLPDGSLKIKLTAPPVDGVANNALIKFLSKKWKIPKSNFLIKKGKTSKNKILEILN
jgi:hypothetical protein